MPALHLLAGLQVDAQRGAEQRGFDVMRDDGIAAEDNLYVAALDQVGNVATRARVNHCRAKHEQNLSLTYARLPHLLRDFVDCQHLDLFGRDVALHKGECFTIPGALKGDDANTIVSDHHLVANLDLVHRLAIGAIMGAINHDGYIHLDLLNFDPLTMQAHLGGEIGRRVKFRGQNAGLLNQFCPRIVPLYQHGPELHQLGEDQFQHVVIGSLDLHAHVTWIGLMLANAHLFYSEVAAAIHNNVPDTRQRPGVDDVAFQFNDFV